MVATPAAAEELSGVGGVRWSIAVCDVLLVGADDGHCRWADRGGSRVLGSLLGATLACLFLLAVFGNIQHLGATLPRPGYHDWQAFLMEIALTGVLLSVILGTASAAQNVGAIGALGVGG